MKGDKIMINPDKAFNNLAIAITQQAIEDYKKAIKKRKKAGYTKGIKKQNEKRIADIESFFKSKWGARVTYNNGEYILSKIQSEVGG